MTSQLNISEIKLNMNQPRMLTVQLTDELRRLIARDSLDGAVLPSARHLADSLKYIRQWNGDDEKYKEELGLFYSQKDNRCQSVDVNQLLLGFAECQPMQLLSLFRYTRSTSILSEARSSKGNVEVQTELNSDKSVRMMTVKRGTQTTTYTFEY